MCVTLIRLSFKHENCDQYLLLFSLYVYFPKCFDYFILTNSFGLEKIQSLLLYFQYSVLYEQFKKQPKGYTQF